MCPSIQNGKNNFKDNLHKHGGSNTNLPSDLRRTDLEAQGKYRSPHRERKCKYSPEIC